MIDGNQNHQHSEDSIQKTLKIWLKNVITGWSNLHEFHQSNSKYKSVMCMASMCLYVKCLGILLIKWWMVEKKKLFTTEEPRKRVFFDLTVHWNWGWKRHKLNKTNCSISSNCSCSSFRYNRMAETLKKISSTMQCRLSYAWYLKIIAIKRVKCHTFSTDKPLAIINNNTLFYKWHEKYDLGVKICWSFMKK